MITTIPSQTNDMSIVDALWTLIKGQTKSVRKALTERLLAEQGLTKETGDITKTAGYREAMDDVKAGRVYKATSTEDMFKQILG